MKIVASLQSMEFLNLDLVDYKFIRRRYNGGLRVLIIAGFGNIINKVSIYSIYRIKLKISISDSKVIHIFIYLLR
jgi:hypothetical protein